RVLPVISAIALAAYLNFTGTRSLLLLVGMAAILRIGVAMTRSRRNVKYIVAVAALVYVGATLLVGISNWRDAIVRGSFQPSLVEQLFLAAQNPFPSLASGGLDTLDGMTLAMKVDPTVVDASWADPVKAVTGLIPSQLWPGKPAWLSYVVALRYTQFGGNSGLFLSGPGYCFI